MSGSLEQWILGLFVLSSILFIGVVIWALLEIRRIMTEAQQTLTVVKGHLVLLIQEMRETTEQADGLVREIREAFQSTSTFWYALGEVAQTVRHVQSFARDTTAWVTRWLGGVMNGMGGRHEGTNGANRESQLATRRSADD